jgi:hypothetical protein
MVDDKTFYRNRADLFESDGWIDLIEELENLEKITNQVDSVESERDLWFSRGQLSILRRLLSMEEVTKMAMEELNI